MDVELLRTLYRVDSSSPSGVALNGDRRRGTGKDGAPALTSLVTRANGSQYYKSTYTDCSTGTKKAVVLYAHRVVFALVHGYWPETVDHRNGDTLDNTPSNLRAATQQQQVCNRAAQLRNRTGLKGVIAVGVQFRADISHMGKREYLGLWPTKEAAYAAYLKRSKELQGAFSIGNRDV